MSDTVAINTTTLALLKREAGINRRPLARHLLGAAKFLGLGALVHAWLIGPEFSTHSLWSWGYLLAWPVPLLFWLLSCLLAFVGYAAALALACGFLWWAAMEIRDWRDRRDDQRWQ